MADMMRLGLREEGEKSWDELLMAQQVWTPLGNTGWEGVGVGGCGGGDHRSAKDKGRKRGSLYLHFPVLSACPLPAMFPTVPPTMTVNVTAASQRHGDSVKTRSSSPCETLQVRAMANPAVSLSDA